MKLLQDLRRRRVFRLAGFYIVGAWVVIQVAEALFQAWGVPETANRYVFIAAALCFPVAVIFGWIYDITSGGIVRTRPAAEGEQVDLGLKRQDYIILVALSVIGLAVLVGSAEKIVNEIDETAAAVVARLQNSVAVLPFTNLDSNSDTGFFSDGVTEEILHRLSALRSLNVLGRTSSFAFRNSTEGPARVAEVLGVRYLLQGSVRRDRNFVRVTANLIDETGLLVWSQAFDRELDGIFSIQSEIASTVASEILNEIVPLDQLPAGRTTSSTEAYNEFLIGRAFYNQRTPGWQDEAAAAFRRAIELDEGFALAHAGLAIARYVGNFSGDVEETSQAARRALELDPDLTEGLAILGLYQSEVENNTEEAIANLRRAIAIDPSFVQAYNWLAIVLSKVGRDEKYRAIQDRGLAIDPLNPPLVVNIAGRYAIEGDPERARDLMLRLMYLPKPPGLAYWELLELETDFGRLDEATMWAIENVRAYAATGNTFVFSKLAATYERLGMSADANYWMDVYLDREANSMNRFLRTSYRLRQRGDYEQMLIAAKAVGLPPEAAWPSLSPFQAGALGVTHILGGEYDTGIRIMEAMGEPKLDLFIDEMNTTEAMDFLHGLAFAYQETGRHDAAFALLEDIYDAFDSETAPGRNFPPIVVRLAKNRALRGDSEAAIATLRLAFDMGWTDYYWIVTDALWGETAELSEFQNVLADMKARVDQQRAHIESVHDRDAFREEISRLLPD